MHLADRQINLINLPTELFHTGSSRGLLLVGPLPHIANLGIIGAYKCHCLDNAAALNVELQQ